MVINIKKLEHFLLYAIYVSFEDLVAFFDDSEGITISMFFAEKRDGDVIETSQVIAINTVRELKRFVSNMREEITIIELKFSHESNNYYLHDEFELVIETSSDSLLYKFIKSQGFSNDSIKLIQDNFDSYLLFSESREFITKFNTFEECWDYITSSPR
jgi:hypothetical protein